MVGKLQRIQSNCKIYVKTFSGAMVSCMEDYRKPSLRNPPDHLILHAGTNDLSSEKSSMEIAESMIDLTCRLKTKCLTSVFQQFLRIEDKKLNEKGMEVNLHLKEISKEKKIFKAHHLNKVPNSI